MGTWVIREPTQSLGDLEVGLPELKQVSLNELALCLIRQPGALFGRT
jgi:hypothetical protein